MKSYVLYHGNCFDGFGAAFAAWLKLGEQAEYIPVSYGKPMPSIEDGSDIYIVDFSYPTQPLTELWKRSRKLVVLDHHHTAKMELESMHFGNSESLVRFDLNKSGAVLAWEYFHPGTPVPLFFQYLQDRDLWTFVLPNSREISCALRSYFMTFDGWRELTGIPEMGPVVQELNLDELAEQGTACLRLTRQQVDTMARHGRLVTFYKDPKVVFQPLASMEDSTMRDWLFPNAWSAPCANATVFFSEVGERLLELHPTAPFAAYYLDRADGKRQWGLRSRPDFDCSAVAKTFGGGGHKQAAGFVQTLE